MTLLIDANFKNLVYSEGVAQSRSVKKVFSEISQNSQETPVPEFFFLIKKRLRYRCFPVNFAKFLRTPFVIEDLRGCFCVLAIPLRNFKFRKKKEVHC